MARNPKKDIFRYPTPTAGASKKTVDTVLTALKIGNGLVSVLSGLLASVLILYSSYVLYDSFAAEYRAYASTWDLLRYKPAVVNADKPSEGADKLAAINKDYRAWLTVYDTTIDYPVVQGKDDLYYASHDIYRNVSLTGAIYLAAGNKGDFSDSYNLIYGHHMDNGAMFGSLDKFRNKSYFKAHQSGIVVTKSGIYDVTFFAVANTDAYEKQIYRVGNRAEKVISFLTGDRSHDTGLGTEVVIYDKDAAKGATKIIALSTCADAETNGRLVVFGKMTPHVIETPTPKPGGSYSSPTSTPSPDETVTLTIQYYIVGEPVFETDIYPHSPGDDFYVVSPQLPGYEVSYEVVRGTIWEDMTIKVKYTPKINRLDIDYIYPDGSEAAPPYSRDIRTGEEYDVASPEIPGYRALILRVQGTNPGRNEKYTVVYIPEDDQPGPDYDAGIRLGPLCVQVGICYE